MDSICVKQVRNFKDFGCEISNGNGKNIQQLLAKCAKILGILNITFTPTLVRKFSRIKVHIALAVPILSYGTKIWTLTEKDKKDWHQ